MKAIQRDMANGQGFTVSLFGKNPTKNDIQYLTDFQNQLKKGVPVGQAWNNTMTNASVAGKKAAIQIKQGTTNLTELQQGLLSTKIATVGLQVASMAFSMILSTGIAFAIANIQKAVQESLKSTSGVTEESRNNLFAIYGDVPDLFDRTATGIRLNTTRLKELQDQQKELQDSEFKEALSDLYAQYEDLSGQIINNANLSDEEYDALVEKRNAVVDNINALSDYISEYEGLTSAYAEWQAALANGEDGDMYDSISSISEIRAWLSSKNKTSVIDEDNASKIPTSEAVMNYVIEIVNNSIADVSTLIGTVEGVAE